jgi:hypothetical protein
MTEEHKASRTLVKSAPELWAECSVADSLARHLGEFGEIKITRLEPETTVAWEGTRASGTVRLEPSGWGTQVTLTAVAEVIEAAEPEPVVVSAEPEPESVASAEPESVAVAGPEPERVTVVEPEAVPATKRRFRDRLRWFFNGPQPQPEPEVESEFAAEPGPEPPIAEIEPGPEPPIAEIESEPEPPVAEIEAEPEPEAAVAAEAEPPIDHEALLRAALDSLGQAHHRPFSRA